MYKHNSWTQDNKTEKLKTKDLITIGILNAIFVVLYFLIAMILMITPVTFLFLTTVAAVPSGVIFMLMLTKVPKARVFSITGIVFGLAYLLSGHFWLMGVLIVAGGILADVVYCLGDRRSFATMTLAFTTFMLLFTVGAFSPMVLFTDAYLAANGGSEGPYASFLTGLFSYLTWPVIGLIFTGTAAGSVVGAYLGKKLLRKHFARAGIV